MQLDQMHYTCFVKLIDYLCTTISLSDIEYAKSYAKMAESAKTLASQQVNE